jgi:uncharacterized membrane protein YebE (DUF533 family)
MTQITNEQYLIFRGLLALAHVDGKVAKEELSFVDKRLKGHTVSPEQQAVLEHERSNPVDPLVIYQEMESLKSKGWFVSMARMIFHADNEFCTTEQDVLSHLENEHNQNLKPVLNTLKEDMEKVRTDVEFNLQNSRRAENDGKFILWKLVDLIFD